VEVEEHAAGFFPSVLSSFRVLPGAVKRVFFVMATKTNTSGTASKHAATPKPDTLAAKASSATSVTAPSAVDSTKTDAAAAAPAVTNPAAASSSNKPVEASGMEATPSQPAVETPAAPSHSAWTGKAPAITTKPFRPAQRMLTGLSCNAVLSGEQLMQLLSSMCKVVPAVTHLLTHVQQVGSTTHLLIPNDDAVAKLAQTSHQVDAVSRRDGNANNKGKPKTKITVVLRQLEPPAPNKRHQLRALNMPLGYTLADAEQAVREQLGGTGVLVQPTTLRDLPHVWTTSATILADTLDLPPRRFIQVNGTHVILLDPRLGDDMTAGDAAKKAREQYAAALAAEVKAESDARETSTSAATVPTSESNNKRRAREREERLRQQLDEQQLLIFDLQRRLADTGSANQDKVPQQPQPPLQQQHQSHQQDAPQPAKRPHSPTKWAARLDERAEATAVPHPSELASQLAWRADTLTATQKEYGAADKARNSARCTELHVDLTNELATASIWKRQYANVIGPDTTVTKMMSNYIARLEAALQQMQVPDGQPPAKRAAAV
jgi:hypothetical protein